MPSIRDGGDVRHSAAHDGRPSDVDTVPTNTARVVDATSRMHHSGYESARALREERAGAGTRDRRQADARPACRSSSGSARATDTAGQRLAAREMTMTIPVPIQTIGQGT